MRQYNKAKQKMINVDDVVKENITILTEIPHKLLIIHISFKLITSNEILVTFAYMLKIHMKENINS